MPPRLFCPSTSGSLATLPPPTHSNMLQFTHPILPPIGPSDSIAFVNGTAPA